MTISMDKKEFISELEKIVKGLIKKGLLPEKTNVKELAEKVFDKLHADKSLELKQYDLKDSGIQKSLGLSCMAEANTNNKFDYTFLFKNENINKDEFKNQLKNLFSEIMTTLHPKMKKEMQEKDQKNLENDIDKLAEKFTDQFIKIAKPVSENEKAFSLLAACVDLLSEQRRATYGVDTTIAGGEFIPPQTTPLSDQLDNLPATGESYEADKQHPQPGEPDPLGVKLAEIMADVAGGSNIIDSFTEAKLLESTTPRPKGPGEL